MQTNQKNKYTPWTHTQKALSEFKSTTQNGRIYNLVGMHKKKP